MIKRYCICLLLSTYFIFQLSGQNINTTTSQDQVFSLNIDGDLDTLNRGDAELYLQRCNSIARAGIHFDLSDLGSLSIIRNSWFMGMDGDNHFRIRRNTTNGLTGSTSSVDALYIDDDDNDDFVDDDPAVIIPSHSRLVFGPVVTSNALNGSGLGIEFTGGFIVPEIDNITSLGQNTRRFIEVHASQGLFTSSDLRLKENIRSFPYGLRDLMKLNAVTYKWKNEVDQRPQLGLIAQEVERVIPEIVRHSEHDIKEGKGDYVMNYNGLIPLLIRSIQDQQREIDLLNKLITQAKELN